MEIDIFVVGALMLGAYIGVKLGYNSGVKGGAAGMYDQLYENGTRKGDKVIIYRLDRLGRSLSDLLALMKSFEEKVKKIWT